ncbi:hypothetical protein FHG87_019808 [Trinorchestia longiramus]|nr:hypothetical protein FHG87_019808 [Trinorchestia longiramus]
MFEGEWVRGECTQLGHRAIKTQLSRSQKYKQHSTLSCSGSNSERLPVEICAAIASKPEGTTKTTKTTRTARAARTARTTRATTATSSTTTSTTPTTTSTTPTTTTTS